MLPSVQLVDLKKNPDERGFFRADKTGLEGVLDSDNILQANLSMMSPSIIRDGIGTTDSSLSGRYRLGKRCGLRVSHVSQNTSVSFKRYPLLNLNF